MKNLALTSALLVACTALQAQAGGEIRVHRPIVDPALLPAGTTTAVRLSAFINHGDARVLAVNAYELDVRGIPAAMSGAMRDAGATAIPSNPAGAP